MKRILIGLISCAALATSPASGQSGELEALEQYLGVWHAEDRETQDGRGFHFVYDLSWFDSGETIVEMRITQSFDDGEVRLLWKGFKGLHPISGKVYYHGFSPSGRAAHGHVEVVDGDLVTFYDGWSPNGDPVSIRDTFSPVRDGRFEGRTTLRQGESGDWREVSTDSWRRVDRPGSGELHPSVDAFSPLIGAWDGFASAGDTELRSTWVWTPAAMGAALQLDVHEGFNGQPLARTMTELAVSGGGRDELNFLTSNGRGEFTLKGRMVREGKAVLREWTMTGADGSTTQGRDRLVFETSDRVRWTQHLDNGSGWKEVPYSPFVLERRRCP